MAASDPAVVSARPTSLGDRQAVGTFGAATAPTGKYSAESWGLRTARDGATIWTDRGRPVTMCNLPIGQGNARQGKALHGAV